MTKWIPLSRSASAASLPTRKLTQKENSNENQTQFRKLSQQHHALITEIIPHKAQSVIPTPTCVGLPFIDREHSGVRYHRYQLCRKHHLGGKSSLVGLVHRNQLDASNCP